MSDIATAREEIQAQRDALMVGRHVNDYPTELGQGCLILRMVEGGYVEGVQSFVAHRALVWAAAEAGRRVHPSSFVTLERPADGWLARMAGRRDQRGISAPPAPPKRAHHRRRRRER